MIGRGLEFGVMIGLIALVILLLSLVSSFQGTKPQATAMAVPSQPTMTSDAAAVSVPSANRADTTAASLAVTPASTLSPAQARLQTPTATSAPVATTGLPADLGRRAWAALQRRFAEARSYQFSSRTSARLAPAHPTDPIRVDMTAEGQRVDGDSQYRWTVKLGGTTVDAQVVASQGTIYSNYSGDWAAVGTDDDLGNVDGADLTTWDKDAIGTLAPAGTAVVHNVSCETYTFTLSEQQASSSLRSLSSSNRTPSQVKPTRSDGEVCIGTQDRYPHRLTVYLEGLAPQNQPVSATLALEWWDFDDPAITVQPPAQATPLATPAPAANHRASGIGFVGGLVVNPATNQLYVSDLNNATLTIADGASYSVVATVPVGSSPGDVAVDTTLQQIYVLNSGYGGSVTVIDGVNHTVLDQLKLDGIGGLAVNSTTGQIFVSNYTAHKVLVFDGRTRDRIGEISIEYAAAIAVNPTTNQVFVASPPKNTISVVDLASNQIVARIPVESSPGALAVNPATNRVYVTNSSSGSLSIIDGATRSVIATVPIGEGPRAVAVNPKTNRIYVPGGNQTLAVIDGGTNQVAASVALPDEPERLAVNPETNRINVVVKRSLIAIVDGATNTVVATTAVVPVATPTPALPAQAIR